MEDKIEKEFSNKDIMEKYNISRQLLKKWINTFSYFKNKLYTLYGKRKNLFKDIDNDKIINNFYSEFKEIYLLKRKEKFMCMYQHNSCLEIKQKIYYYIFWRRNDNVNIFL